MKKAFILFLFLPVLLKAQQGNFVNNLFIGIQGGLNISDYIPYDSVGESNKSKLPLIGANVTMPFNSYLNVRIGALYSPKGTNYNVYPKTFKVRYSYVDFPVTVQIKPMDFLFFEGGVVPSIALSSKALYGTEGDSVVQIPKKGSGMEVALQVGAGITLQKGFDLGISYDIPTHSSSFDNIRITLTYNFKTDKLRKQPKVEDDIAYQQIIDLHNNAILVRLKTSEYQIKALKEMGKLADAEKLQRNQLAANKQIIQAFRANFNFCPVYFFYSNATSEIRQGQISGNLLNDSLSRDSSLRYNFSSFYIAEFGYIDPDTNYVDRDLYDQKTYQSDSALYLTNTKQIEALVIRNSHFTQLRDPFPYNIKMVDWSKRKTYAYAVALLNEQLHYFFKQSVKQNPK